MKAIVTKFDYTACLTATFPYTAALSKNRKEIHTRRFSAKKIKNPEHVQAKILIQRKFARLAMAHPFVPRKRVLVYINVYNVRRSCDAHNFTEGICDALEAALGVNDRYFDTYTCFDLCQESPRFVISVYQ